MESLRWKATRYDDLISIGGEDAATKLKDYSRLKKEISNLRLRAKRYSDLVEIGGDKAAAKLKRYDDLVEELAELRQKARRYDDLIDIGGERAAAKLRQFNDLTEEAAGLRLKARRYDDLVEIGGDRAAAKLKRYDAIAEEAAALRLKAKRYDELLEIGGDRAAAKLRQYDAMSAELAELRQKVRRLEAAATPADEASELRRKAKRYDDLIAVGGERAVQKLRAYDQVAEDLRRLRWKAKRYDDLVDEAGGALARRVRNFDAVAGSLRETRRALERMTLGADSAAEQRAYGLVFVLGGARTGTHLVDSYLSWSDDTHDLQREASPLLTAMRNRDNLANASETFSGDANRHAADIATQTYLRLFFDARHAQLRKPMLTFRSPALTRYVYELQDLIPFASVRFVCCLRDPRDACLSLLEWHRRAVAAGRAPILPDDAPAAAAEFFMSYYNRLMDFAGADGRDDLLLVKYEDAVSDPKAAVARLAAFAGLDLSRFDPGAPWPGAAPDYQAEASGNMAVTPLYGQAPSAGQVGRYRQAFAEDDIRAIEQIAASYMTRFGYD